MISAIAPALIGLLEAHGWKIRPSMPFSADLDRYRDYLAGSRGEFTVAKDQNVRLRTGWFSERSAQYLACGRPVITQDTAFGSALPTGEGLFAFSSMKDILAAVDAVNADYERHCRAAAAIAHELLNYEVVLKTMLDEIGLSLPRARADAKADTPNVCRLHLCLQWLGWSSDWTPPKGHQYDWLSEAVALSKSLGFIS